jgi:glycosyltransferase involved in cell wall biosynthesis
MTGEYPRAADTFIQREVAALRSLGYHIQTFSVRRPAPTEMGGPELQSERTQTFYLLPCSPLALLAAHLRLLLGSPLRYMRGMALAWKIRPPGLAALLRQIAYFAEAALLAAQVRRRRLVHLHNHFSNSSGSVAAIAAEMGGFSFSLTVHGPAEFFAPQYWHLGEKARRALFVNCISQFCRSQVMIFAPRSAWPRLHIIHCGVDPALFAPAEHRGVGKRLLFVGRVAAVKGVPVLLEALAQLRQRLADVELTIAGDGPDRRILQAQAAELGVGNAVRFLGYQSQSQVRELLAGTDVFVMSSFAEGVPVVLMEAMAAGVPVVATRVGGVAELVEEGKSGFLVAPGDAPATARKIEALLIDPELRSRFGAAGRAVVQSEFNVQIEARRLAHLIDSALAAQPQPVRPEPIDSPPPPGTGPQASYDNDNSTAVAR